MNTEVFHIVNCEVIHYSYSLLGHLTHYYDIIHRVGHWRKLRQNTQGATTLCSSPSYSQNASHDDVKEVCDLYAGDISISGISRNRRQWFAYAV